ncbi:MAG: hypothetical protein COU42_01355 [Candidatus Nealsonbacteria bacterium CG10_big_fil_rev_8_21_14_0_10_36_24]|uniref:Uncharacterized protein n=2 Tax=Candidatus Nealsoniibacteriota TaxID=1817911 RepID=A0A2H0YQQ8_9BACT|nr:MAG: hypothetical protein COU42_01355 [Candidatus Nealsonbacteria bacterium CG10_big_fil_rev_8_21_14_0_10_36_24]PIS40093.1 MAG: hypothetical protein COT32_01750 [Candidatus Nealsonbacteria bacterium CG08_land_8_20_14_0_20_36_22]
MKILGIIDLVAAFILLTRVIAPAEIEIPLGILIGVVIILIIKALLNITGMGGIIDITTAALLIISSFWLLPFWILIIGAIAIGQKGVVSMFMGY